MNKALERYQPTHIAPKVEAITAGDLERVELGYIDTVAFDVDGTLMNYHEKQLERSVQKCLKDLSHAGLNLYVISNAYNERADELHTIFCAQDFEMKVITPADINPWENPKKYRKPSPAMLNRVMEEVGSKVLMVGDQMQKDILSANIAAVYSVLVPRRGTGDDWRVRSLQRPLEFGARALLDLPLAACDYPDKLTSVKTA